MYGYSSQHVGLCECIFISLLVTVISMFGKCISSSTVVLYIHEENWNLHT